MGYALLDGRKLHVIAVEISEISVVTGHGFVAFTLKFHLSSANGAANGETFAHEEIGFGHVADSGSGLVCLEIAMNDSVYYREWQWKVTVA